MYVEGLTWLCHFIIVLKLTDLFVLLVIFRLQHNDSFPKKKK